MKIRRSSRTARQTLRSGYRVEAVVKPVKPAAAITVKASTSPVLSKDTLIIIARLVEIPGKFPPNDLYNYVFIMKYRVVKVLKDRTRHRTFSGPL